MPLIERGGVAAKRAVLEGMCKKAKYAQMKNIL